jgi:DNA-binding IclR family transcriptional regulator
VLQKLSDVLALFTPDRPELSVREIAKPFRWPKSTAYRILARVEEAGFLDRDERSGLYRLGIRLATLGELARHSTSLQRIASAALHRLSAETAETATLMLLHQPLMLPGLLGARQPLHSTAGGKVFLAWAPPGRQRALIRPPLKRYTSTTITDVDTLLRELDVSRRRGYTIVNGENVEDVVGVAAPIHDHHGNVSAALTVGGPRSRTATKLESLGIATIAAAASVSAALGYHGNQSRGATAAPRRAAAVPAKQSRARARSANGAVTRPKGPTRKRGTMAGR